MPDSLGMTADEMRAIGHSVVDLVVDHIEDLRQQPAISVAAPSALLSAARFGPVPMRPSPIDGLIHTLVTELLPTMQHGDHPRYFARVPGPSSFTGVVGDWLATGFNAIASSWGGGAGPSAIELVVVDWMRQLMGMPDCTEGLLLSGGSIANLTALAAARSEIGEGAIYFSDQTHSCVAKALHILGIPQSQRRMIDTGSSLRLTGPMLAHAIETDRAQGIRPTVVVATAGSTNTGAIDDLQAISALCQQHGLWLHIDGAYGGPARLSSRAADQLVHTGAADSMVIDPHKWFFQPYDVACLMVSRPGALERFYTMNPEYLADVQADHLGEVDLRNRGPELTRRARAVKVWLTVATHGVHRIAEAVERGIELAEHAEQLLAADDHWQIVTPAQIGIVTFVRVGTGDRGHQMAAHEVTTSGFAAVTCTVLNGRQVLRLCTINPQTTNDDVADTITRLAAQCDRFGDSG